MPFNSTALAHIELWRSFWVYWGASKDNGGEMEPVESGGSVLALLLEEVF